MDGGWQRQRIDYTHEREWRVPGDLTFDYGDVEFVIVATGNDGMEVVGLAPNEALHGKILLMDNYSRITALWPVASGE